MSYVKDQHVQTKTELYSVLFVYRNWKPSFNTVALKLDLYDKKQPTNKLKTIILSETSILYLICQASFILIVGLHL